MNSKGYVVCVFWYMTIKRMWWMVIYYRYIRERERERERERLEFLYLVWFGLQDFRSVDYQQRMCTCFWRYLLKLISLNSKPHKGDHWSLNELNFCLLPPLHMLKFLTMASLNRLVCIIQQYNGKKEKKNSCDPKT